MKKVIDAVYDYLYDTDNPNDCKKRLDNVLNFVIGLRHSYVDNDRQVPALDRMDGVFND